MAFINGKEVLFSTVLTKWGVVQTKGDSVNEVMSQGAVTTELNALDEKINKIDGGIVVENYSKLIALFEMASADEYKLGQAIYVMQNGVPDLWISDVDPDNFYWEYTYTTDAQFIADLNNAINHYKIGFGHYYVSLIETEKQDLSSCATKSEVNALRDKVNAKFVITDKRLVNLEAGIPDDDFITDNSTAYVRDVPSNALPYAEVAEIGGMTYKEGDVLRSAPVTEVVSEGINLASPFDIGIGVDDITGAISERSVQACTDLIRIQGVTSCVWSGVESSLFSCIYFYNSEKKYMGRSVAGSRSQWVITSQLLTTNLTNVGGEVTYIRLWYGENVTTTGTVDLINNTHSMLNKGTTALPYRPYIKRTLPIPETVRPAHGIPDTDCYDCIRWRYDEATDKWVREYERRMKGVDLGTLDWTFNNANVFQTTSLGATIGNKLLCANYEFVGGVGGNTQAYNKGNKTISYYVNDKRIYIRDDDYTNATTFKSAMSGVMLVYELATPEITDISHLLPEDNLIGVEGGGSITMQNEYGYDVPAKVTYQIKEATL